jgi:NADH:ubiquinone oxidoreductase subunit 6 (subunit J)
MASVAVFVFLLLPAIQEADLPESAQSIQPSVEALGYKLMDPYVVTLEVLALLLTASLIGAVAAAQSVREKKEGTDDT